MNDIQIATTRTGVNTGVLAVLAFSMFHLFGWEVDVADPVFIVLSGAGVPVFYRLSLVLCELWPPFGYILFGVRRGPAYSAAPAE